MPNHCCNDLYITGPDKEVAALLAHIGASSPENCEFDFNKVIPYPEEYAKLDKELEELGYEKFKEKYGTAAKDGFNSGGYSWCVANWGTKWSAYNVIRRDYYGVCVTFNTAWSPPVPVVVALHKMFPKCSLTLESFERGMRYAGGFTCPSKEDFYSEHDEWKPGLVTNEWEFNGYSGCRGG